MRYCSFVLCLIAVTIFAGGCRKDKPPSACGPAVIPSYAEGVYITNEGNFQFGNASVSYYAEGMSEAIQDLFAPANNRPLGDVCQSMYFFNNRFYVVVNNSGKVEVVNPHSFVASATITGFLSPRYFLPVSNSKAYVTDLYANAITIVNLSSHSVVGAIPCPGWTEELHMAYGRVFVTNRTRRFLYVINPVSDNITDSVAVGYGANSLVEDKNGKLWVLCSGNTASAENASLCRINPVTLQTESVWTFSSSGDSPWRLSINGTGDTLYYLNGGVYRMAITDDVLPGVPFVPSNGRNFYGVGVHPRKSHIYVADAMDYVQRGRVYVYSSGGTLITSFLAGIIPGDFYFYP